jgi:hypothetical protein
VFAAFNFSAEAQTVNFDESLYHGDYIDFSNGDRVTLTAESQMSLGPWGYRVFVR